MSWIVFHNFASGEQVFGFYEYEEDAKESYESALEEYRSPEVVETGVAVEVGYAEVTESKLFNWNGE